MLYTFCWQPFLEFAFMRRALVGCAALSLGCGPVGLLLVLRRMSLMGDAMSHAILPGVAVAFLGYGTSMVALTFGGLFAGLLVALLAAGITRVTPLKEDGSFAALYLLSLAFGVVLVSKGGSSVDVMHLLFGSILAVDDASLQLTAAISSLTWVLLAVWYRPLLIESVDPEFLQLGGYRGYAHTLFFFLVVLNLVAGFQTLGTLMVVGLMMLPATTALLWSRRLSCLLWMAPVIALFGSYGGLLLSFHMDLPSGPAIILTIGAFYILSLLMGTRGGVFWRVIR